MILLVATLLLALCSCKGSQNRQPVPTDSSNLALVNISKDSGRSVSPQLLLKDSLIGVWWGDTNAPTAAFELEKEGEIYFPDPNTRYKYKVEGNKILVQYEEAIETAYVRMKGMDTLLWKDQYINDTLFRAQN